MPPRLASASVGVERREEEKIYLELNLNLSSALGKSFVLIYILNSPRPGGTDKVTIIIIMDM